MHRVLNVESKVTKINSNSNTNTKKDQQIQDQTRVISRVSLQLLKLEGYATA